VGVALAGAYLDAAVQTGEAGLAEALVTDAFAVAAAVVGAVSLRAVNALETLVAHAANLRADTSGEAGALLGTPFDLERAVVTEEALGAVALASLLVAGSMVLARGADVISTGLALEELIADADAIAALAVHAGGALAVIALVTSPAQVALAVEKASVILLALAVHTLGAAGNGAVLTGVSVEAHATTTIGIRVRDAHTTTRAVMGAKWFLRGPRRGSGSIRMSGCNWSRQRILRLSSFVRLVNCN